MKAPIIAAVAATTLFAHGLTQARPDPQQRMVAPVLEQLDTGYGFATRTLDSADGQRHYRLYIGRPNQAAPVGGYPVVYLLDGNAAVGALDRTLLRRLNDSGDAPLIVAIGSAMLTRPGTFQHYAAASPSLWWGDGAVLAQVDGLASRLGKHRVRLSLMRGDAEAGGPGPQARPIQAPGAAMDKLLRQLRDVPALRVKYRIFPNLAHGPMLPASLEYTLKNL